ncbi:uncharacterized protein GLRG_10977 [Colletotrichum graminicola M1.001]|uniref:Uncharacterized protein n=1 Tax=Colletotrichum graminicola (strain M1.001 / M2 / FGSC 10212) TaxID=645133 RepID=E3QY44_COLGM|nr:uncharacterized protein GLRG_10977 [Colletotrichum graminicola M1.001]EFQ35782.1 hypothetical protein GLRG_10977 [Colletotrichum graminicola M1.001]
MRYLALISVAVATLGAISRGSALSLWEEPSCLCRDEALDIANRWLSIFSTGGVSGKEEVATIVSQDLVSADETFGPPTYGIDAFWEAIKTPSNLTTNVTQATTFFIHTCDQIALNWQYDAVSTGYNS